MFSVQFNNHSKDLTCNFLNRYSVQFLFKGMFVKITVFQEVMLCIFIETLFHPECENSKFFQNLDACPPNYMAPHSRKQ